MTRLGRIRNEVSKALGQEAVMDMVWEKQRKAGEIGINELGQTGEIVYMEEARESRPREQLRKRWQETVSLHEPITPNNYYYCNYSI